MKCPLLHGNIQKETDRETVPKFRTYRSVFLFHQNFTATVPKFRTFHSWLTACQPRPTVTTEGVLFFFTRILPRWDQNSGLLKKKIEIFFHIRIAFYINMGLNQPNRYPIDPTKLIKRIHTTFIRLFTASIDDIESK